jgi:hypothetical protein
LTGNEIHIQNMKKILFFQTCLCILIGFNCTPEAASPAINSLACDCKDLPEQRVGLHDGMLFHPRDTAYTYTLLFSGQGPLILLYPICSDSNFLSQLASKGLTGDSILVTVDAGLVESIECEGEAFDRVTIDKGQPLRIHTIDRQ